MRTTEWRITKCYYSIFKAVSALMHCKFDDIRVDGRGGSHVRMWKKHRREMMTPLGNSLYSYPFMYFPQATEGEHADNWFDWTVPFPVPEGALAGEESILQGQAEHCLESIYDALDEFSGTSTNGLVTFYDALLKLRKWASYTHGGVFARLYGEGYIQGIDEALRLVTFSGLAIAEVGSILALGWDWFSSVWSTFSASAAVGINDSLEVVQQRYRIYHNVFS